MARRPQNSPTTPADLAGLIRKSIPPIHPAGHPFILGGLLAAGLGLRWRWARRAGLGFALASAAFFRHPHRVTPAGPGLVVAAADGEIVLVDEAAPPAELGWADAPVPRISTFLSILDVHVQRAPVSGTVTLSAHTPGRFLSADQAEASAVNERQSLVIRTAAGTEVGVVQIAGLVARRIVCEVSEGAALEAGQTYGLIRFGSRVDLYLPAGSAPAVLVGQRAVGGETIVARLP
ncbi:MAG: phosphatidylserine decarboxylase [Propionibacteriaceae bacterium]|jgi:phosphatidylserine decarboxylase|nr:phosphatidylserine decarboxylase [Propionibacteriaceae bacterium]